ncbi:MAG TPA: chemotaxis protein CheW, partial [Sphingomonas sp.]|nr:chemotaxis protein CheW [Sphingomonas sp.]
MSEQLFLIAHIAGRGVAIDSAQVESVVDIGAVIPTPRAAPHIRGLAALRSRVVTVIDTHAALGLPKLAIAGSRAVITVVDGHHYAV